MTISIHKAIRDFWHERTRTAIVTLAISLGIAAFAAVMSSYAILTRELDRGYLATNPASAVFRMDAIDSDLIQVVLSDGAVSDAEPRRVVSAQIKSGPIQWRNLMLFVVGDYGSVRISKLAHESGSWPPAKGEILLERDAFQVARASIGDLVTVKTANGVEKQLLISGSVHDVGQAQARMENIVYGYITVETLAQLGEQPYLDQLNVLVAEKRFDEDHIRQVTFKIQKMMEESGHRIRSVDIPKPGKHPHSELMGALLLAMSTFGLFVLALSGVLVVNLLTAIMASQVRHVGVMKAVGASRWQLGRIYLSQAFLLGAGATVIALPLGLLGSRALCNYMAVFLNFDINSYIVPLWVFVLVAFVGLITPVLAGVYPVWRGTRVPVRVALSDYGVSQNMFGTASVDRLLAKIGGRSRPLLMSIRNSFRRRVRLALTLLTLSAGGLFFMAALNIRASIINTLDNMFAGRKFDLSVSFASPQPSEKIKKALRNTPGITDFEEWFNSEGSLVVDKATEYGSAPHRSSAGGVHSSGPGQARFSIAALPVDSKLFRPDIVAGRALMTGDSDAIVVNTALAARNRAIKVGSTIDIRIGPADTTWRVVGISGEAFSPPVAYIPLSFIAERHPGMTNSLRLALDKSDADSLAAVKAALDENLQREELRARSSLSKADSRLGFDQHMLMIYVFLIVMSAIIGGVGGLGLMTTMSVNVLERRREMGVLRAIGATPRMIGLIVLSEGLTVGLLGWAIAALAAWPISKAVGNAIVGLLFQGGLAFRFEPLGLFVSLAGSVILSSIASLLPAWRASRLTLRELLAYE
jgi:putative ABC transport system permease protein